MISQRQVCHVFDLFEDGVGSGFTDAWHVNQCFGKEQLSITILAGCIARSRLVEARTDPNRSACALDRDDLGRLASRGGSGGEH